METTINILREFWGVTKEMSPYLLFGFFIAGLLSVFVSERLVEKHLGGRGLLPVIKSALFGVPLPLCSCGVIPVTASLRKSGASRGAALSFLIATPQTGVDSIMVTYSLLGPVYAIFRPIAAFITGIVGGGIIDTLERNGAAEAVKPAGNVGGAENETGNKFIRLFKYGFLTLPQDIAKPLAVGIIIAALLTVFVPDAVFAGAFGGGILGMLVMMAVGIPLYVCATASVPIAAALIAKGISPGAALVFLMTGPATNAAAISTVWKVMGKTTAFVYLGTVAMGSLLLGLLLNAIYEAKGVMPGHIHENMLPGWIQELSAVILLGIIVLALYRIYFPKKNIITQLQSEKGETMPDVLLNVKGMTCSHCVMNVKRALVGVQGVKSVEVDLQTGNALVMGSDLNYETLKKSVEEIGYSVADKN